MIPIPSQKDIDWFNRSVLKRSTVECWDWLGYKQKSGHGQYRYKRTTVYVHRFAYFIENPNFDQSLCVCHKCDNPSCVNPSHMFLGTFSDNIKDKINKSRQAKGIAVGGLLSEKNVKDIVELCNKGNMSQSAVARRYGIHQGHVSRLVNGHRWRHLSTKVGTVPATL